MFVITLLLNVKLLLKKARVIVGKEEARGTRRHAAAATVWLVVRICKFNSKSPRSCACNRPMMGDAYSSMAARRWRHSTMVAWGILLMVK